MYVDRKTKTKSILPLIDEQRLKLVLEQVPPVKLGWSVVSMSISDFEDSVLDPNFVNRFMTEKYAFDAFGKLKTFIDEREKVMKYIDSLQVEPSDMEKKAAAGIEFPSLFERMRHDLISYFGLHSIADAEKMSVGTWLFIEKKKTADEKYQRRFQQLMK